MRKQLFASLTFFLLCLGVRAQVGINPTNAAPHSSAMLDVSSTNKGVLLPRLTNTEMTTGIASPVEGLMVYNTTLKKLFFYNGSQWQAVSALSDSSWSIKGNANTNPATHFFGTTDNKDIIFKRNSLRSGLISLSNTSWGAEALNPGSTGTGNTANGYKTLFTNSTGSSNTANGYQPLYFNSTGSFNTANGYGALFTNSTGSANTANGFQTLLTNSTGNNNTALGYQALVATTGSQNTAIGFRSGADNNGNSNVFIGSEAGVNEAGSNKLYISSNDGDANNALVYGEFDNKVFRINGRIQARTTAGGIGLDLATTDSYAELRHIRNTIGTTDKNLHLQFNALAGSSLLLYSEGLTPTITVKSQQAGIGKTPATTSSDSRLQVKQQGSQNGIGIEAASSSDHWDFYVGSSSSSLILYLNGALRGTFSNVNGAYTMASDRRLKKDISLYSSALSGLMQLQAYRYHYLDNKSTDNFSNGFMAQDVQKVFPNAVVELEMKDGEKRLGINYQYFTVLAVKGLQEQQKIIDNQEERLKKLEAQVQALLQKN